MGACEISNTIVNEAIEKSIEDPVMALLVLQHTESLIYDCRRSGTDPTKLESFNRILTMFKEHYPTAACSMCMCMLANGFKISNDEASLVTKWGDATDFILQMNRRPVPPRAKATSIWRRLFGWVCEL